MPLLEVSHNVRESESSGRKRSHHEFSTEPGKIDTAEDAKNTSPVNIEEPDNDLSHCQSSPLSSPALSEAGSDILACDSTLLSSPSKSASKQETSGTSTSQTDSKTATDMNPPPKRKRLTAAEKEARDKELAEKKKEREEKALAQAAEKAAEKAKKEEEKAKKEEEKAVRAKEKEEKRKQKEEEDRIKADKKRKKEEELQRIQEEKDRKARSQKTLGSFFKIPSTPKKADGEDAAKETSPAKVNSSAAQEKQTVSEYSKIFKPFFVKENTQLAPAASQMDETTRETKSKLLDGYIASQQNESAPPKFDPIDVFSLPSLPSPRGKLHQPVRHIMETAYKAAQSSEKTGSADANRIFTEVRTGLSKIPMKVIAFSQDVRPPYYGTVTFKSFALGKGNMYKLARRSMGRRLPLDYDYDSEAEWQDEEDGEDLDLEDEEEELDDEDDMDGFLDDSEDAGISRRVFADTMKPDIMGPCFENQNRKGPVLALNDNKMEFIHEGLDQLWDIDPFSTKYWEPEPSKAAAKSKTPKVVKSESDAKAPPPAPTNAFAALGGTGGSNSTPGKLVKPELMNDIKQAILDNKALSKVGIVDFIFHQFKDSASRMEVKNTIEHVAEKKGAGRTKEWELKPGHEITL
ncbi:chromatin assembly factor 1 subunit a [Trichoderma arundinaceum]|uniref:Chromatin assembly factor 1 subunit a n=1 Tax=Trichoderma arundinaceum TaxID=490622 RepID=A0A395NL51_TRIAR|nr:chromatin assembly factor 1 subunit a [Trichoderma arundinaceum]